MSASPLLSLDHLSVKFGAKIAVDDLTLAINAGERIALVGESGSGKTVTGLSILNLLPDAVIDGKIQFAGQQLLEKGEKELREIRGRDIAMIFQEPMSALNPLFTIGNQIIETLELHEGLSKREARVKAIELLTEMGVREPQRRVDSYPHQLSGGQRQRAMIAISLACRPRLLIADEPTTALDVTIRARIVDLLFRVQRADAEKRADSHGMAILLITHDLHLVRKFAQRVAVMENGKLVEVGETETLFNAPQHPYTKKLLESIPHRAVAPLSGGEPVRLRAQGLHVEYRRKRAGWKGLWGSESFAAVKDVNFDLRKGETVGIVGESGSGKSSLALAILGLLKPRAGSVEIEGRAIGQLSARERRAMRARVQVVFQDPFGSLSPRQTIEQIIGEGLGIHRPELSIADCRERVASLLQEVGLPADILAKYPHEFSGGQRQRIAIARALAVEPVIVVLDEPTSALDVSIQRQVLELLTRLQETHSLSYVLISHDISVVNAMSHQVLVMHEGQIVEAGSAEEVLSRPQHPYTQRLLEASLA
jgi:microcin C transport system ATP-binding protein